MKKVTPPPLEEVRALFKPYEAQFVSYWLSAWQRWLDSPNSKTFMYRRTRANDVFDYAMQMAIPDMEATPGVVVDKRKDTAYFAFASKLFVRMKKGNERGLGSNYPTQMNLAIVDSSEAPPSSLFDDVSWKIEITYRLGFLEMVMDEILVVARHDENVLWSYPIYKADGSLDELPTPPKFPVSPPQPPAAKEVLGVPAKEENKKEEAK